MNNKFAIEKDVPIPPKKSGLSPRHDYPIGQLEPGASLFIPCEGDEVKRVRNRLFCETQQFRKTRQFTSRRVRGGIRIWRVKL